MSHPTLTPPPPSEPDEPARGLEDPRAIHQSPEEVIPERPEEPGEERLPDKAPRGSAEHLDTDEVDTGIVDPRSERFGPDL